MSASGRGLVVVVMVEKSGEHQLRLVVFPIIYRVSYIPAGCLGFQPSTVVKCYGGIEEMVRALKNP